MRSALLAVAVAAALPALAFAQTQPPPAPAQASQTDIAEQRALLQRPETVAQVQRDEAAARLAARQTPEADAVLLEALGNFVNMDGQLAVARALANDPTPDPAFIRPLAGALGTRASDAASRALVHIYKTTRNELGREVLQNFIRNGGQPPRQRAQAVAAMGRLVDKPTAEFLIGRLTDANEHVFVQESAIDALMEITGEDFGQDLQRWQRWWAENQNRPEIDWVTARLARNAALRDVAERNRALNAEFLDRLLRDAYAKAAAEARPEVILGALRSEAEDVRLLGAQVLFEEVAQGQTGIYQKVAETLVGMVGDTSPAVRARVAATMDSAGDAALVPAILAQLPHETNKEVLQAMMKALSARADLRAIAPLLARLDDPSYVIAEAAAVALTDRMADRLRLPENERQAALVAERLRLRLASIRGDRAADDLRFRIVEAMSDLAHPSLRLDLSRLTAADNPTRIRQRAYLGLRNIGNPETVNVVAEGLSDRTDGVRLNAVNALETVGDFEIAPAVARLLDPGIEPNGEVRAEAWRVLQSLFRKARSGRALEVYAERFKRQNDHDRREKVLAIMEEKFEAEKDAQRLAFARTNRGEELLDLARQEKLPGAQIDLAKRAAEKLGVALDYYQKQNAVDAITLVIMRQRLEALLLARDYAAAVEFSLQAARKPGLMQDVLGIVGGEVKRLENGRAFDDALKLLDALKVLPIDEIATRRFDEARTRIQNLRNSGGYMWRGPSFAAGRFWDESAPA